MTHDQNKGDTMKIKELKRSGFSIHCETPEEFKDAVNCYNREMEDDASLYGGLLARVAKGKGAIVRAEASAKYVKIGGGFGRFEADVTGWIKPYFDALKERTGAEPFPFDFTPITRRITHTHITESLKTDGKTATAVHIGHVYGYTDTATISPDQFERWGVASLLEHVGNEFGKSHTPPEFEPVGTGGLYKRNHSLRRTTYQPHAMNEDAWQALFGHWLKTYATNGQRALINRFARVYRCKELFPSLRDSHRDVIHLDEYQNSATWAEFRAA